jgi:phosphatidylinositol glycan class U
MAVDRRKVAVFGAAFVLRLLLVCLFPSLPDLLTGRVEVSTPVNSFKRRTLFTPNILIDNPQKWH